MGPGQFCVRYLRTFVESFAENSLKLDLFHSKPVLVWRHGLCQRLLFSTVQLDCNVQSIKDWQYCSILHIAYIPHYVAYILHCIAYCTHYPTLYCILHTLHSALRSFLDTNFVHFLPFPPHDTTFMPRKYSITSFLCRRIVRAY